MLNEHNSLTLIDQQTGNLAFKVLPLDNNLVFDHLQRLNYFSLILIFEGEGVVRANVSEYQIQKNQLFCFSPFQPFMIQSKKDFRGIAIHFHSDFFCIFRHQKEVSCNGVLFNDAYESSEILLAEDESAKLTDIIEDIKRELSDSKIAQSELIVSYLKIFLVHATRIKLKQLNQKDHTSEFDQEPRLLKNLKDSIELHFREWHTPSDYADDLNTNLRNLSALTKKHFHKTLSNMISDRIIIEAKRELYLTSKSIREIAFQLGFSDEFYFSRLFKKESGVSPTMYRETVGFAKAELKVVSG